MTLSPKHGVSMARVGIPWAPLKSAIRSCLIGVSSPHQVESWGAALDLVRSQRTSPSSRAAASPWCRRPLARRSKCGRAPD